MRRGFLLIVVLILGVLLCGPAAADNAKEAQALVEKAVAMAKKDGMEKTLKAVNNRNGPFVKGDMYVWAGDFEKTTVLAHPFIPGLVGAPGLKDFKDKKGNPVFVLCGKVAAKPGHGWVEYWYDNPRTGRLGLKRAYVSAVEGTKAYMACGYFPEQ